MVGTPAKALMAPWHNAGTQTQPVFSYCIGCRAGLFDRQRLEHPDGAADLAAGRTFPVAAVFSVFFMQRLQLGAAAFGAAHGAGRS